MLYSISDYFMDDLLYPRWNPYHAAILVWRGCKPQRTHLIPQISFSNPSGWVLPNYFAKRKEKCSELEQETKERYSLKNYLLEFLQSLQVNNLIVLIGGEWQLRTSVRNWKAPKSDLRSWKKEMHQVWLNCWTRLINWMLQNVRRKQKNISTTLSVKSVRIWLSQLLFKKWRW